jgi:PAS domain S-box-containing protein
VTVNAGERVLGRYRLLSEHARDIVLFIRLDGRIVEANDAAVNSYGYERDEFLRLSIGDLRDPATTRSVASQMHAADSGGLTFETMHRRKDGSTFPVEVSSCGASVGGERLLLSIIRDITDRKRADEALQRSELRYRKLFEESALPIQIYAPDGRPLRVNRAWTQLWGVTLEQLPDYNLLADKQLAERGVMPLIRQAFAGETVAIPAVPYVPDRGEFCGQPRWVRSLMYSIKGPVGEVEEVVLLQEDVTESRQADEQIRLQARLLDSVGQAVIATQADGTVVYWNRAAEDLYGWPTAEAVGRNVIDVTAAEISLASADEIMSHLRRGESWAGEFFVRRRDGTVFPAFVTDSPVRDESGEVVGVIGVSVDISERKRAEQAGRLLADAGAALASLVDPQTTLQQVADLAVPAFADWCAVDLAESGGQPRRLAVAHVDPAQAELVRAIGRHRPPGPARVFESGRPELVAAVTDDEVAAEAADPDQLRILRQLAPRSYLGVPLQARGRTVGVLSFVTAASGRHYDARDLALAEELARRASIALENARLYEELRAVDRRKDEFLATLAHELRNPLAPIRNGFEIIRTSPERAVRERAREMMERQFGQLVRLVDDLLDVSRITQGKLVLRREPVSLAAVVASAVEIARPTIEAAGHELTLEQSADSIWVNADAARLSQVIGNLLTNAGKYTDRGGRIQLAATGRESEAIVSVRDNGIGIAADHLPHLFQMFSQVAPALDRSQGGLGIGLALVKGLVEMHGGRVEARSDGVGRGSEFIVTIPTTQAPVATESAAPTRTSSRGGPSRCRVLIADDNADTADSLALLLRALGHEVRTARDGREAVRVAETFQPAVVVLDIGMPVMSGYEAARRIREQPWGDGMALVAVSGWGQAEDKRRAREAGFSHHFTKPVDPMELVQLLAAAIPSGSSGAEE